MSQFARSDVRRARPSQAKRASALHNSAQMLGVEHEQVARALTPNRADRALNVSVLLGRAEREVPAPHGSRASPQCDAKGSVITTNELFRCGFSSTNCRRLLWFAVICAIARKRFSDLTHQPLRSVCSSDDYAFNNYSHFCYDVVSIIRTWSPSEEQFFPFRTTR